MNMVLCLCAWFCGQVPDYILKKSLDTHAGACSLCCDCQTTDTTSILSCVCIVLVLVARRQDSWS